MANKDFYKESEIPQFQEEVCKKTCIMKGSCIEFGYDNHFFLMCPHYFNWKIGFKSFVAEQLEWQREHPEEVEKQKEKNRELAKKLRAEKKKNKKEENEQE